LLTVENLRGNVGLAMSSGGGSLLSRVRRLAMPSKQGQLNAGWWLASMVSIATVAIIATSLWVSTSRLTAAESDDDWGQSVNGLQIRAVPVSAEMNDDAVDLSKVVAKTKSQQQLAFAVELKNITDKPIKILDARYGEGYGDSKGKANSDWSAQFLFTINYYDKSRKLIARPKVEVVDHDSPLSGAMAVELQPGESRQIVLRHAKWLSVLQQRLDRGKFTAVIHYHGLPLRVDKRIREYRSTSAVLGAWNGDATSLPVSFELTGKPAKTRLIWRKTVKGLRGALEFSPHRRQLTHGEKPDTKLHVQNVSNETISLGSHLWLSELLLTAINEKGKKAEINSTWYSGWTLTGRIVIEPQEVAIFDAGNLGIAKDKKQRGEFGHVTHRTMIAAPGAYKFQLQASYSQGAILRDGKGKQLAPHPDDWFGSFKTGRNSVTLVGKDVPPKNSQTSTNDANKPDANKPDATKSDANKSDAAKVTGTIVDSDGKPVVGAKVIVFQGEKATGKSFVADDDGKFRVPRLWRLDEPRHSLVVQHNKAVGWFNFRRHRFSNDGQKNEDGSFEIVLLPLSRMITGQITDTEGKPLPGITVGAEILPHEVNFIGLHWKGRQLQNEWIVPPTTTDADGKYILNVPAETSATLRVAHENWASARISVPKTKTTGGIVQLPPASIVTGRVVDGRTNKPISGVRVAAQMLNAKAAIKHGGWGETVSNANGNFKIAGLPAGTWSVMLTGNTPTELIAPANSIDLAAGETKKADFTLQVGLAVRGKVLDNKTDQPLIGCEVYCTSPAGGSGMTETTDVNGEFEFHVPPGKCSLNISGHQAVGGSWKEFIVPENKALAPIELRAGPVRRVAKLRYFIGPPLKRKVSKTKDRMALRVALEDVCDQAGLKLELDVQALKFEGITQNANAKATFDRIALEDGLGKLLAPFANLTFTLDDDKIFVSSKDRVAKRKKEKTPKEEKPAEDPTDENDLGNEDDKNNDSEKKQTATRTTSAIRTTSATNRLQTLGA